MSVLESIAKLLFDRDVSVVQHTVSAYGDRITLNPHERGCECDDCVGVRALLTKFSSDFKDLDERERQRYFIDASRVLAVLSRHAIQNHQVGLELRCGDCSWHGSLDELAKQDLCPGCGGYRFAWVPIDS